MLPRIPLCVFEFTYQVLDPMTMPAMPGALWHGVFGRALYQQSCIAPDTECNHCMLLHQCDYPYLFHRIAPPDSEMMQGKEIPVPHVIRVNQGVEKTLDVGDTFTIDLVFVSEASRKYSAIIRAMLLAGMGGLGKQRSRVRLLNVRQTGLGESPKLLMEADRITAEPMPQNPPLPDPPLKTELKFITPYKPSGKQKSAELDVSHLLMAIVRRVSLLQYFYTGKRLEADFRKLKALTETTRAISKDLRWHPGRRYSASHNKTIDISGWLGSLEIDMETIQELWPYLWLGQWLSVGKNASMGFGGYAIS